MKKVLVSLAVAGFVLAPTSAFAHNHLANPSGVCNQSEKGVSPGNSGETSLNPAGKPVGKANAGLLTSECDEKIVFSELLS